MRSRLQRNQKESVGNEFEAHPLMQMCQWAMKRQEVKMLSLRLSPEEVFCEAAGVIDRIVASPKEVDTLLHALWDTLLSDYLDLTDGATPADAERAAACVYYAAIAALIYCSYAGYKYGIVRKLMADVHSRYADWRELEPQLFPCVERYGPSLGQWMDDYVTSDSYLSDAIEEVLRPKRKAAPQAEEEPAFKPTRNTFLLCNGSMAVHVELMLSELVKEGWMAKQTQPDTFLKLFRGVPSGVRLVWLDNGGVLKELFRQLIEHERIAYPKGEGYLKILRSHFVNAEGQDLGELKSTKCRDTALPLIQRCLDLFELEVQMDRDE